MNCRILGSKSLLKPPMKYDDSAGLLIILMLNCSKPVRKPAATGLKARPIVIHLLSVKGLNLQRESNDAARFSNKSSSCKLDSNMLRRLSSHMTRWLTRKSAMSGSAPRSDHNCRNVSSEGKSVAGRNLTRSNKSVFKYFESKS